MAAVVQPMPAEGPEVKVRLRFQPKQGHLLDLVEAVGDCATFLGDGGARGGGKSGGGRRILLQRCFDHPATDHWLVRRTFPQLLKNHIERMWAEYPDLEQYYAAGKRTLVLPNTSRIQFCYAETTRDVENLIGPECMTMVVDQAEQFTEEELRVLRSNVRWPAAPFGAPKFIALFNPGGPGAPYLSRVMLRREYKDQERAGDFAFVQAFGWDNVEWVRSHLDTIGVTESQYYSKWTEAERKACFLAHSDYGRYMASLPTGRRMAWLEGRFDKFDGQFFNNWQPERLVRRAADLGLEAWSPRWISVDWGYRHPSAIHWHAQTATHTVTYRELVRSKMGEAVLAMEIVERSKGEKISAVYLSPDAFAKRTSQATIAESIGDVLELHGLPRPVPADNDRVGGWRLMHDLMGWEASPSEGREAQAARWLVASNCEYLIATIPLAEYDGTRVEDLAKFDANDDGENGDDALDGVRYGLKSRLSPGSKPAELQARERVLSFSSPMDRVLELAAQRERASQAGRGRPMR